MPGEDANKVVIPEPEAGKTLYFTMQPDQTYLLGFAPETSTIERNGQDVQVLFDNDSRIILHDFFFAATRHTITLELRDGTLISGRDLAEALAMSLTDFRTDGLPGGDVTDMACSAAGATGPEAVFPLPAADAVSDGGRMIRPEDVLDTAPQSLFDTAQTPAGENPGAPSPEGGSGAYVAGEPILAAAEQIFPDELSDPQLLMLLRMGV